ncbi:MAG TPA: sulfite exporter TauE/SafE family protein [Steroidobacteraceae bacterium]|nr:sulfite exporter TauE/SafE family protein [Steroidobacteraceae bacterium]
MPLSGAAAFVAGLAGSGHCLAMCGGVAGALGMRAQARGASAIQAALHAIGYQLGRIGSYTLAGALCGTFGRVLARVFDVIHAQSVLRIAAGVLLIAIALRILVGWRLLDGLERLGGRFWSRLMFAIRTGATASPANPVLLGMLWGWLPCALTYSMLLLAMLTANGGAGALTMFLFGLGTLPSMLGSSLMGSQLMRIAAARSWRTVIGLSLAAFGLWTLLAPFRHVHGMTQ